jgi:predicted enzyme related to lactoylglutathione lyase
VSGSPSGPARSTSTSSGQNEAVPDESGVFRNGGISYVRIPAGADPKALASFYERVFGWRVDADRDDPSFEDGTGHVIGHISTEHDAAGTSGFRPYVFVKSVQDALERADAAGGSTVDAPYPEGELTVASFSDPAGNVIGIWQRGSSDSS